MHELFVARLGMYLFWFGISLYPMKVDFKCRFSTEWRKNVKLYEYLNDFGFSNDVHEHGNFTLVRI